MLVLTLKPSESLTIGNTTVTIVKASANVRLGIESPRDVKILRCELSEGAKSGSLSGLDEAELFTGQPKGFRGEERSEQSV